MANPLPDPQPGVIYLTEGGQETEMLHRHGFELPEFALFPLLDDPRAAAQLRSMYEQVLETALQHDIGVLLGGLDYRASPDWGAKLGYSPAALDEAQLRCIDFLRDAAAPYVDRLPSVRYSGIVGPRGDAYTVDGSMTAEESERYHSVQIASLARADVDLVQAMTFNSAVEAIGVARAAARHGLPASVSFTLDSSSRLHSGPSLREAIELVDEEAGEDRPAFYGINCSHPLEFLPAIEPGEWFERVRILRPNAALMEKAALCTLDHLEAGDPLELAGHLGTLADRFPHLDIWGGCCGTWDTHLDQIVPAVRDARR